MSDRKHLPDIPYEELTRVEKRGENVSLGSARAEDRTRMRSASINSLRGTFVKLDVLICSSAAAT